MNFKPDEIIFEKLILDWIRLLKRVLKKYF